MERSGLIAHPADIQFIRSATSRTQCAKSSWTWAQSCARRPRLRISATRQEGAWRWPQVISRCCWPQGCQTGPN